MMDLQLGLGISSSSGSAEDYDSNGFVIETQELISTFPCHDYYNGCFDQTFGGRNADHITLQTLPLLAWNENDQYPEHGLHYDQENTNNNSVEFNMDANGIVGWPPIGSWRKRICNQNRGESIMNWVAVENGGGGNGSGRRRKKSLFVKVNMEGEGIGRKVDLSLHHSLDSLLQTLVSMFGRCEQSVHAYQLVYQEEEGFWHLAEDVAWGTLITTAHRLKLLRNGY